MVTYKFKRLFFDIETKADPDALALMPDPKAPGNIKDPAKIEAAIAEKKAEQVSMAALDPDYAQVYALGYSISYYNDETIHVLTTDDVIWDRQVHHVGMDFDQVQAIEECRSEADLLKQFWAALTFCEGRAVGFNVLAFDFPFLLARSMYLGVKPSLIPNLAKFRTEPITDLYAIRYGWGPGKGLKQCAKLLGIEIPAPGSGAEVANMTYEELTAYQESDVILVQKMFERMNGVYFNL
jgi:hypothetical protein